jgi:hypothetical protein
MSAPIGSATTSSTGLAQALDSSRPQVQSRRVSLKLGPLGITYATDQLLWSPAEASSASDAADPLAGGAANAADASGARQAEAEQAAQTEAQATGRTFSQEMLDALRRQIAGRQADTATYGPDGALTGAVAEQSPAAALESQDAGQDTGESTGQAAQGQTQTAAPAGRMRQAIAAYLACARDYGSARPMLTAVA